MNEKSVAMALTQGAYFAAAGVWPLVHLPSFESVTGPKVDKWLVRTVGALITVVGGVLISSGAKRRVTAEMAGLAIGTATALGAVDIIYAGKGRISRVYLADAVLEAALVVGWIAARVAAPSTKS